MNSEIQETIAEIRAEMRVFDADLAKLEEHVLAIKAMRAGWIRVKDKFPEIGVGIMGYMPINDINWFIDTCVFDGFVFKTLDFYTDDVIHEVALTHWMPLPTPPKEE